MTDLVFLHGGGQGGWVWNEAIAALKAQAGAETHRILALDGPGCGSKRGRDTARTTFDEINAELVADIEAAGLRDVVLVGHSQAGMHMPAMLEARPALFSRLIFVSCIAIDPGLTAIQMSGERIHGGEHPFNDREMSARDRYRAMFCNDMADDEAEAFLDKLGFDQWPASCYTQTEWRREHLADVPVSYVLCLQDSIVPLPWQERFAERVHARSKPRIDAGHQVMNTRPQALAEVLLREITR